MPRQPRCITFDMNPSDFLNDQNVVVMTAEQVGVYVRLLFRGWMLDEPGIYPAQDGALMRLAGCTPEEWARAKPAVSRCFDVTDGRWVQKRQRREYEAQSRRIEFYHERAKAGGEATKRKFKHSADLEASSEREAQLDARTPSLLHSSTPTSPPLNPSPEGDADAPPRTPPSRQSRS